MSPASNRRLMPIRCSTSCTPIAPGRASRFGKPWRTRRKPLQINSSLPRWLKKPEACPQSMNLAALTLRELRTLLTKGTIEPRDIVLCLQDAIADRDEVLHGYVSWDVEMALAATEADFSRTLLRGIPIAIKDLINVKGQPC